MLGYSKFEWIFAAVIGLIAFFWVLGREPEPPRPRQDRASADEIFECERRIKATVVAPQTVDVKTLTGMSSDKQGAGGTSRVKLYFDVQSLGGPVVSRQAVCQFADGMPALLILDR